MIKKEKYSVLMLLGSNESSDSLRISIRSILNQTLPPAEFVIVIDDTLPSILHMVIEEEFKKTENTELVIACAEWLRGKGFGSLLAFGVKCCSYEYIARMDSDDYSLPERCEKQLNKLIEHPNIVLVGTNAAEFLDNVENIICYRNMPERTKDIKKYMKLRNPFNHPSVMFRRSVILAIGNYNPNYSRVEDYELWYRVMKSGYGLYNIQEPLVLLRAGDPMVTRRSSRENIESNFKLRRQMREDRFIGKKEYVIHYLAQKIFLIIPNKLKRIFYYTFLRSKKCPK